MTQSTTRAETYGRGSLYFRKSDQLWVAAVEFPRLPGEKRRRKTFTGKTEAEAQAKLGAYRAANPAPEFPGRAVALERARTQGKHARGEWFAKVRASGSRCYYCSTPVAATVNLTKDHMTPLCRGGSDGIDNIAVACKRCNAEKGRMTADEYAEWKLAKP